MDNYNIILVKHVKTLVHNLFFRFDLKLRIKFVFWLVKNLDV